MSFFQIIALSHLCLYISFYPTLSYAEQTKCLSFLSDNENSVFTKHSSKTILIYKTSDGIFQAKSTYRYEIIRTNVLHKGKLGEETSIFWTSETIQMLSLIHI